MAGLASTPLWPPEVGPPPGPSGKAPGGTLTACASGPFGGTSPPGRHGSYGPLPTPHPLNPPWSDDHTQSSTHYAGSVFILDCLQQIPLFPQIPFLDQSSQIMSNSPAVSILGIQIWDIRIVIQHLELQFVLPHSSSISPHFQGAIFGRCPYMIGLCQASKASP